MRIVDLLHALKNKKFGFSPRLEEKEVPFNEKERTSARSSRLTATDVALITDCKRKLFLKYNGKAEEKVPAPMIKSLLQTRGNDYERKVVKPESFKKVVYSSYPEGKEKTLQLMHEGSSGIYQGILYDGTLSGRPDLLIRASGKSRLGNFYYFPVEIKSGKKFKSGYGLQVMAYLYLLEPIQGVKTSGMVRLGDNTSKMVHLDEQFSKWLRLAQEIASGVIEPQPVISSRCRLCEWREHCLAIEKEKKGISLIPQLSKQVRRGLLNEGIDSLPALANIDPNDILHIKGVGPKISVLTVNRAKAFVEDKAVLITRPNIPLSATEIYFDLEGIQKKNDVLYYLFGWYVRVDGSTRYHYLLAERPEQEYEIWKKFLSWIDTTSGSIFHYGNYEKTAIRNLVKRYGDDERVSRLMPRFVDLYEKVKGSVALPITGYSLKEVALWLGYEWTGNVHGGTDTIVEYLKWERTGDSKYLDNIRGYNEQDCRILAVVKDWLSEFDDDKRPHSS